MTTNRSTSATSRHAQRYGRQAHLVQVHRAGLAAEASVETAANRFVRRRAIRNGRRAVEDLLDDLDGLFRFIARRYTRDRDDLDDLVQLARLHALRSLPKWDPSFGASVASWVTAFLGSEMKRSLARMHPDTELLTAFDRSLDTDFGIEPVAIGSDVDDVIESLCAVDVIAAHRSHLNDDDARHLDEVLDGKAGATGSPWHRGRVRALLIHPTSGVAAGVATGRPSPRQVTPPDIDSDTDWVATHESQPGWQLLAACAGSDPGRYFPERGVSYTDEALERCANCPVRLDCLATGCEESVIPGLWGGQSLKRRTLIRQRVRTLRVADAEGRS